MPRKDIRRNSPVNRYGGIPAEDGTALDVARQVEQTEDVQKIRCTAQLPDYNFQGCGNSLNSSNARKVRGGKRLPICESCRRELCEKFSNEKYELNQLINMEKSPHCTANLPVPGSGRRKKKQEADL